MEEICRYVTNPSQRRKKICGDKAIKLVTVNIIRGKAQVPMCEKHIAEQDRASAALRVENK